MQHNCLTIVTVPKGLLLCALPCAFSKDLTEKTQIWQYEFLLHIFMCFFNLSCAEHNCLIIVTVAETSSLKVLSQALQYGFTFMWMPTCKSTDSEIAESTFHSAVWEGCSGACSLPFRSGVSLVTSVMKGQFCKWDSCYSTVKKGPWERRSGNWPSEGKSH